jgi:osmotically-inducible protein OsmY
MIRPFIAFLLLGATLCFAGCVPLIVGGAAVGGTALVASDRRQPDIQFADEGIENQVRNRIEDALKTQGRVEVTAYNKQVLLVGEARDEALKQEAERIAAAALDVKNVVNEIQIAAPRPVGARSTDANLTSAVKARFVGEGKFNPVHVKVVTDAETVYLLGLVTRKEADDATNISRHTSGVKKVVRVFEYILPPNTPAPPPPEK